jgi:hypothetical protein
LVILFTIEKKVSFEIAQAVKKDVSSGKTGTIESD